MLSKGHVAVKFRIGAANAGGPGSEVVVKGCGYIEDEEFSC
jgi:hypothetical protein